MERNPTKFQVLPSDFVINGEKIGSDETEESEEVKS